jgi:hypothetical protein
MFKKLGRIFYRANWVALPKRLAGPALNEPEADQGSGEQVEGEQDIEPALVVGTFEQLLCHRGRLCSERTWVA